MKFSSIKRIIVLSVVLISHYIVAQGTAFEIGYYKSSFKALKLGLSYRITDRDDPAIKVGAALHSNLNNQHRFYINSQINILNEAVEVGVNISTKEFEPTIGLNILGFFRINTGYSVNYSYSNLNHMTFGVSIFIGDNDYYDKFSINIM